LNSFCRVQNEERWTNWIEYNQSTECTAPNNNQTKVLLKNNCVFDKLLMVDRIASNPVTLVYLMKTEDHIILFIHPNQAVYVPVFDKLPHNRAEVKRSTKFNQIDLSFCLSMLVTITFPPTYYVCCYQLNFSEKLLTALDCIPLIDLHDIITNRTAEGDIVAVRTSILIIPARVLGTEKLWLIIIPCHYGLLEFKCFVSVVAYSFGGNYIGRDCFALIRDQRLFDTQSAFLGKTCFFISRASAILFRHLEYEAQVCTTQTPINSKCFEVDFKLTADFSNFDLAYHCRWHTRSNMRKLDL
jgi:hypothetical protein